MTLLLEPQYVILIALIIILLVHFKSRLADRNIVLSGILLALISGFVLLCELCFENVLNNTIEIVLIFYWENSRFKGYWIQH
jgi:rod shape determining protein RodA